MFHNVLAVEHMLKYQSYSNTPYITKLVLNSAIVVSLLLLCFLQIIYSKLNPGSLVVPAVYRIFFFFAWETFCPLVVICSNKSYQQFAMKKIRKSFSFVLLKLTRERRVTPVVMEESRRGARIQPR